MKTVAVVAPKTFGSNKEVLESVLDRIVQTYGYMPILVVSDGSALERQIADEELLTQVPTIVRTDWDRYKVDGKSNPAANVRNIEIAQVADELFAVDNTRSTNVHNLIQRFKEEGKTVIVHDVVEFMDEVLV